jgi:hypothetical protein
MCVCEPQVNCTWKLFAGGTGESFTEVDGERLLSAVVQLCPKAWPRGGFLHLRQGEFERACFLRGTP